MSSATGMPQNNLLDIIKDLYNSYFRKYDTFRFDINGTFIIGYRDTVYISTYTRNYIFMNGEYTELNYKQLQKEIRELVSKPSKTITVYLKTGSEEKEASFIIEGELSVDNIMKELPFTEKTDYNPLFKEWVISTGSDEESEPDDKSIFDIIINLSKHYFSKFNSFSFGFIADNIQIRISPSRGSYKISVSKTGTGPFKSYFNLYEKTTLDSIKTAIKITNIDSFKNIYIFGHVYTTEWENINRIDIKGMSTRKIISQLPKSDGVNGFAPAPPPRDPPSGASSSRDPPPGASSSRAPPPGASSSRGLPIIISEPTYEYYEKEGCPAGKFDMYGTEMTEYKNTCDKTRYKKLSLDLHPDLNSPEPKCNEIANAKMKTLNAIKDECVERGYKKKYLKYKAKYLKLKNHT